MQANNKERIILFRQEGQGAVDSFANILALSGNLEKGFNVETSIEGDSYNDDYETNSYGEIIVKRYEDVFDAEELFEAIINVTSDDLDRWDNIDWSWDVIISNLESQYPKLADELKQITQEHLENI